MLGMTHSQIPCQGNIFSSSCRYFLGTTSCLVVVGAVPESTCSTMWYRNLFSRLTSGHPVPIGPEGRVRDYLPPKLGRGIPGLGEAAVHWTGFAGPPRNFKYPGGDLPGLVIKESVAFFIAKGSAQVKGNKGIGDLLYIQGICLLVIKRIGDLPGLVIKESVAFFIAKGSAWVSNKGIGDLLYRQGICLGPIMFSWIDKVIPQPPETPRRAPSDAQQGDPEKCDEVTCMKKKASDQPAEVKPKEDSQESERSSGGVLSWLAQGLGKVVPQPVESPVLTHSSKVCAEQVRDCLCVKPWSHPENILCSMYASQPHSLVSVCFLETLALLTFFFFCF
ncbi:Hypothetical predicted protein [Pelobates cultripes]|uniref:Uncharacterized protein n=1 Tax=Pelobates cultripes TaxID=61616 RepID=A0AAD1RS17_PELCU|nr:Hypothetical predicted protein [Pelobates cultripes]